MKSTTQRIENKKNFKFELEFIEKINSFKNLEAKVVGSENVKANFSRESKTFKLDIQAKPIKENKSSYINFFIDNGNFITEELGNTSSKTEFKTDHSVNFITSIELDCFHEKTFDRNGIYKAFYTVKLSEIKTFRNEFETIAYQRDGIEYFNNCLRVDIENKEYDIIQLKDKTQGYYVFDCLQEQTFDDFSKACYSIQQAIGFINLLMVGGEKFVFDNKNGFYYSNYIRPTLKGMYKPIITNPYKNLEINKVFADRFYPKLTRISLENLSNLAKKIHYELEFSTAILIILEATSIKSLLVIPSSFAVIIELLSKHLTIQEPGLVKPINNSDLESQIIKELHKVIDNNSDYLDEDSIIKLKNRLKHINQPTNKMALTNNEKLILPFEQIGIKLSLDEISIIEHRNDLLHGNVLLKNGENRNEEMTNYYMAYVSAKLFTLISKLILKSIGYSGYVYNQAKYLEELINVKTNEEYFEKI